MYTGNQGLQPPPAVSFMVSELAILSMSYFPLKTADYNKIHV